ncbi:hypothetical protein ACQFX9_07370 [Aliinostoc sp. HNIBRCY26]|uniref:hypothetical protein n=1 Tax=Aliinostoc sp. HNIBRCY26 TaxID=3418997 RepID=UPI003D057CC7
MKIIILAVLIFLILLLLYVWYHRRAVKPGFSSQQQVTPPENSIAETSVPQSSVYSMPGRLLTSRVDIIVRPVPASSSFVKPIQTTTPSSSTSQSSVFPEIESQLRELAKIAWTTEKSFQKPQFLLDFRDFVRIATPAQVVEVLIRHAERVTPGFQVPYMVPRVLVTPTPFAAGMFEEDEEGWVTIKVSTDFFQDKLAAQAILAHEVCHYILSNSGIRKSNFELNERYTDLCMFVCGFGEIFLAGYKRQPAQNDYRPGHRLGYLTDAEYQFAHQYVIQLRQYKEILPPTELDVLKKQLLQLLYSDESSCERNIEAERKRSPHKSELELYRDAISRLERDRRR